MIPMGDDLLDAADGGGVDRSAAERADRLRELFEEEVAYLHDEDGEPMNLIRSGELREAVDQHLRRNATVIQQAETSGAIIGEMVVKTTADTLPHLTKGEVRGALAAHLRDLDAVDATGIVRGETGP